MWVSAVKPFMALELATVYRMRWDAWRMAWVMSGSPWYRVSRSVVHCSALESQPSVPASRPQATSKLFMVMP